MNIILPFTGHKNAVLLTNSLLALDLDLLFVLIIPLGAVFELTK